MDSFGMCCVKYLLFLFNLLFALSGIVILTVGILIQQMYYTYQQFIDEKLFSAPMILIVVGVIVFVVAFFGCCGAVKESNAMLITFAVMLGLIFIMEVAGGVTGYLLQDDIHGMLETRMEDGMKDYGKHQDVTNSWDVLQYDLECCGVKSGEDWKPVFLNSTLPHSCCHGLPVDLECNLDKASKRGCLPALQTVLEENTMRIGAVGIGVACVQLIGVIFACCLARSIRREYETV
ncbi:CD63 antigen [Nilaparvata lugens]|uniref:CD63 antigen n=1 Tax=Nilaparvata lugens TaxID=108931 RepID=UPI00193DDFFA|nr:CD63 antigen [Nilaparvata lugens]